LKAALQKYEGTLLLVSHDRDFLQGMSNIVYEFKDHKIREYLGDINFFLEQRNLQNMREVEKKTAAPAQPAKQEKPKQQQSFEDQKKNKTLQNRLSKIESQIQQLEGDIQKDDRALAEHPEKLMGDASFFSAYENKKKALDDLMLEWEQVQEEIES
jgi:ATP-binding cassette, subfamily F, member 3